MIHRWGVRLVMEPQLINHVVALFWVSQLLTNMFYQRFSLSTLCFVFEGILRLEFSEVSQNHLTFDEQGQWSRCVMFGKKDF